MTTEEFKRKLDAHDYSYVEEESRILVIGKDIWLSNCVRIPSCIEFINNGNVWIESLVSIPSGVVFSNSGIVHLKTLIGKTFHKWDGNIDGIEPKRLLNKMISIGLFDRR